MPHKITMLQSIRNDRGHLSLKISLMLLLMSMVLLPFAANLIISLPQIMNIIESAQRQQGIASLKESYFAFDKRVTQRKESVRLLSDVPGIRDFLSGRYRDFPKDVLAKRLERLIDIWFADEMDVKNVGLLGIDGREKLKLIRNDKGFMKKIPDEELGWDRKLVQELLQKNTTNRNIFIVKIEDIIRNGYGFHIHQPIAKIASAVRNYSGNIVGMAVITMDISSLLIQSHFDFLATGAGYLVSSIGGKPERDLHDHGDLFLRFPGMKQAIKTGMPVILKDIHGGEVAWFPILPHRKPAENLWAGRRVNESLAEDLKTTILSRIAGVSAVALIFVLIIVAHYSYRVDRYRKELVEALQGLLLGRGAIELKWKGPIEIVELAEDLNELFKKFIDNDLKRREAIAKLSDLNTRMKMILDNAAEGIIEIDMQNKITFVNSSACRILGFSREELLGKDLHSIIHYLKKDKGQDAKDECPFCVALKDECYHLFKEDIFLTHDQQPIHVEYITAPVKDHEGEITGLVMCLRDVSARKAAEEKAKTFQEQLRQAQKMEAIGTLAGGIAHDFNNLLTAVRGYAELLEFDLKGNARSLQQLKSIRDAADKAASLVRQLLAFSRKQMAEKRVIDLNILVTEQQNLLKRFIGEDVTLDIVTSEEKAIIYADPNMIAQVILNMVVNARDALVDSREKKIAITVERLMLSSDSSIMPPDFRPGRYVVLSILDTGSGMAQHILDRIFDPFFTTKDMDKGTGLGLSVAYGIVEQHGGWIQCNSEPGKGTSFRIFLPEHEGDTKQTSGDHKGHEGIPDHLFPRQIGRGQTAFVLEDDSMVLNIIKDVLEAMGFNVVTAASLEEANYLMTGIDQEIGLVVSDVILPDGNGMDFVEQVLNKKPDVPTLLLSGYIGDKLHMDKIRRLGIPFLAKPFRISEVYETISRILKR